MAMRCRWHPKMVTQKSFRSCARRISTMWPFDHVRLGNRERICSQKPMHFLMTLVYVDIDDRWFIKLSNCPVEQRLQFEVWPRDTRQGQSCRAIRFVALSNSSSTPRRRKILKISVVHYWRARFKCHVFDVDTFCTTPGHESSLTSASCSISLR
jgi:hypothetical protein